MDGIVGRDAATARQDISLSLDETLVARARAVTPDLSRFVERALADHVARAERRRDGDAELHAIIVALNAFHAEHGLLSDEFPSL